jgi:N-acetylglutamate synthase-like GNAT family acetyltransferase
MGRGIGKGLVPAAEELAAKLQVRSIYLLTTTAVQHRPS